MIPSRRLLLALCALPLSSAACLPKDCKAFPGSPDWPSDKEWSRLNKKLDGQLLTPELPGGVCHEGQPNYDEDQCPATALAWKTFEFHVADPVSLMMNQFQNYTCLPDAELPCSEQGYPSYVANVTTAEHVKAAVDFARKKNVRLVVKATGHDYLGRSTGPGSLSIWTHHLNDLTYHEGQFTLAGSGKVIEGDAITAGAGTQMIDLYNFADAHGRLIVGGGGKTVGIAGYITGGGHSIMSPHYGLAADNVLEMEVVTPGGKILTVNEDQHADLFWAIRGGGGSTFGVITSITLATHPDKKITHVQFMLFTVPEVPNVLEFVTWATSKLPYLAESGLSGYLLSTINSPPPVPLPGLPPAVAGLMGATLTLDTHDPAEINAIFKPLNDTIQERWPGQIEVIILTKSYDSYMDYYTVNYDNGEAGNSAWLVSRLMDKEFLTGDALPDALETALVDGGWLGCYLVAGRGVNEAKPRGGSNAVHPAWRTAYVLGMSWEGWLSLDTPGEEKVRKTLDARFEGLRQATPGGGSYMNEGFPFERDWQQAFWGDNYERLLEIKREVDPQDVLWCSPCVGNENWEEKSDGRLCRIR